MGTRLYFQANDGVTGFELWVHDSASGLTWQAADIWSGSNSGLPSNFVVAGDRLYFQANDGNSGIELWMLDIKHIVTLS